MDQLLGDLAEAMEWLGRKPDTLFLGQGVGKPGTRMSASFKGLPADKRIEFPVAEELQMGVAIGLSLEGFTPVCVFPRWNFVLPAMNQLVNHLDRLPLYSDYRPKVIIRTAVGRKTPLDAGQQHGDDFTQAVSSMLRSVKVIKLSLKPGRILGAYKHAYERQGSTLIVEDC